MQIKGFDQQWADEEIEEYINTFNILILFEIFSFIGEAHIVIHGKNITEEHEIQLKEFIAILFGGQHLTDSLAVRINDFAMRWYNKVILKKRARVINFKKGKK